MSRDVRIFISHKMPRDTDLAILLGRRLALYGADRISVRSAEDFLIGANISADVDKAIAETDLFILLYTGEDENWNWCLIEAGKFLALTKENPDRQIIVIHRPDVKPPAPLAEYLSVPVVAASVRQLLNNIYVDPPWAINPGLDDKILEDNVEEIIELFSSDRMNFDLVPNFTLTFFASKSNMEIVARGKVPGAAVVEGTQRWEMLFDKNIATGSWIWAELVKQWSTRDLYEYEIARMIDSALKKAAPEGCYIRPEADNKLYRLTLRRYEESAIRSSGSEDGKKLWFYFSASPLDIPIFGIGDMAEKRELLLYHMVNITWFTRRRLIDELFDRLRARIMSQREDPQEDERVVRDIKDAIISIDVQSAIRRILDPSDIELAFDAEISISDQKQWLKLKADIFEAAEKRPPDRRRIAKALMMMADMNARYYKLAAAKFSEVAQALPDIKKLPNNAW